MPYDTDERLKNYLDTNQMHREQMCLAVLRNDRRFSDVRPRHSRGGPDGARDIEAVFNGVLRVFGAVGFQNQANDSDEYKKKAMKKFRDDLSEALKEDPKPEGFVFLTNVNLTVGEEDELVGDAKGKGLAHAEVFGRERIRIALDNPDGFSIRFQYLGIRLSEAEQATFFARWGEDIQGLISDGFGAMQKSLNRIHFLQEAALPLAHLTAVLELDREYSGAEIGHFRAFAIMQLKAPVYGLFSIMFGAADNSSRWSAKTEEDLARGASGIANSMCGGRWERRIPEDLTKLESKEDEGKPDSNDDAEHFPFEPAGSFTSVGEDPVRRVRLPYTRDSFIRLLPGPRLLDMDDSMFVLLVNRSLAERVKVIQMYANEYKVIEIGKEGFYIDYTSYESRVPMFFSTSELADPWVRLRPKMASAFQIRFSEHTPRRFYHALEVPDHKA